MDNIITMCSKTIGYLISVKFSKKEAKIIFKSSHHSYKQKPLSIKTFILLLINLNHADKNK